MRPPELMQTPRAPGWVVGFSKGTRLKPSQAPSTRPQRLSLMLFPPLVRVTCTLAGASMRCNTGSVALHAPLPLVSWQTIQPQSQSLLSVALVQPLVLLGISVLPPDRRALWLQSARNTGLIGVAPRLPVHASFQ